MSDLTQQQYNKLRDMIIVGEQEITNLKRAKVGEQSEIQRLVKQKQDLEDQCDGYVNGNKEKKEELGNINKEYQETNNNISKKRNILEILTKEKVNLVSSVNDLQDEIKELNENKNDKEKDLKEVSENLEEKRSKLKTFLEKAKELMEIALVILIIPVMLGFITVQIMNIAEADIAQSSQK